MEYHWFSSFVVFLLWCLSFFDLWLLITPLVSSNSSCLLSFFFWPFVFLVVKLKKNITLIKVEYHWFSSLKFVCKMFIIKYIILLSILLCYFKVPNACGSLHVIKDITTHVSTEDTYIITKQPPRYSWNIVENVVKHHNPPPHTHIHTKRTSCIFKLFCMCVHWYIKVINLLNINRCPIIIDLNMGIVKYFWRNCQMTNFMEVRCGIFEKLTFWQG